MQDMQAPHSGRSSEDARLCSSASRRDREQFGSMKRKFSDQRAAASGGFVRTARARARAKWHLFGVSQARISQPGSFLSRTLGRDSGSRDSSPRGKWSRSPSFFLHTFRHLTAPSPSFIETRRSGRPKEPPTSQILRALCRGRCV